MTSRTTWLNLCLIVILCNSQAYAQVTAAFTATTQQGCAPVIVQFNDVSKGSPTWWRWDLGNGTVSFLQHPATTYFNPGTYTVKLVAGNDNFKDSVSLSGFITVNALPSVNFSASATSGCFPLPVQLSDLSDPGSGTVNSWQWDFGDGTISTEQSPSHTYTSAGQFNISLRVKNSNGCEQTLTRTNYISLQNGVKADYTFSSPNSCKAPATIRFTNRSSGTGALSYHWDFGDGQISTDINPAHIYSANGAYTVKLVVKNATGCSDSVIKVNTINIGNTNADFNAPAQICAGQPVTLNNASVPTPVTSVWTFSDGTSSTALHPVKTFTLPGTFSIKLVADFGNCKDSVTRSVQVLAKPTAAFTATNAIGCKTPHSVNFTDQTTGAVGWEWDFGDGSKGSGAAISHIYTRNGSFDVKLVVTNAAGCTDTLIKKQAVQVSAPVVTIGGLPLEGCVPLVFQPAVKVVSPDAIASWQWDFGDGGTASQMNSQHTYTKEGVFTVKLIYTTNGGCKDSVVIKDAVKAGNKPVPAFTANPTDVCASLPVTFTDASTGKPDKWEWHFGDGGTSNEQNPGHYYTDTGYFHVKLIVSANGCRDSLTIVRMIHVNPPIAIFNITSNCVNKLDRQFIDKSKGALTWNWDFGDGQTSSQQNPAHNYVKAGSYTVKLTVTNGTCFQSTQRQLTVINEAPAFDISATDVCKGTTVSLNGNTLNPQFITAWNWIIFKNGVIYANPTGQQPKFTFNDAGNYTIRLKITDKNGCTDSVTKTDILRVNGPSAAFQPANPSVCPGSTISFNDLSVSDGTHPISKWTWNYGDGQTESLGSGPFEHTYTTPGIYNIVLTVTDSKGCSNSRTLTKGVNISRPVVKFNAPDTLSCTGAPVRFIDQTVSDAGLYAWDFGDGTGSAATAPSHAYTTEGIYTIKLVVKDRVGCSDSLIRTSYIAIRNPKAAFTADKTTTSCPPLVSTFTNQSQHFTKVVWDFGDGTGSNLPAPSHFYTYPGTYRAKLLITSVGGCRDSAFATMDVKGPTGSFNYDRTAGCAPTSIKFTGASNNAAKFIWDFNDGTTNTSDGASSSHAYTTMGVYLPKMILEDPQGCRVPIPGKDTIRIYDVNAAFGNNLQQLCDSGRVMFNDQSVSNDLITRYDWSFGDGSSSVAKDPVHFYKQTGQHTVTLKVTTRMGCTNQVQLTKPVKVVAAPMADITGPAGACIPAVLNFEGKLLRPDTSSLLWKWDFRNGETSPKQIPGSITFSDAGQYAVQLIVSNSSGCADTVLKTIHAYPLPVLDAGLNQVICRGATATLSATGANTFQWQADNTLSCVQCSTPLASPLENRLYRVKGINGFGCEATDSVQITVKQPFTIAAHLGDTLCKGESVQLFATGAELYEWYPSAGLDKASIDRPKARPDASVTYRVVGKDDNNCFTDTAYIPMVVYPWPVVNAGEDLKVGTGSSVTLKGNVSPDVTSYRWTPAAGLSCTDCLTPVAAPKQTIMYTLEASNEGGCLSRDMVSLHVFCDNSNLFLPNTFSPNSDGHNDVFYPRGKGVYSIRAFRVFNRWGDLVFEKTNIQPNDINSGWNGTHKGKIAPPDVYIYTLEVVCTNNTIFNEKGNITLIR